MGKRAIIGGLVGLGVGVLIFYLIWGVLFGCLPLHHGFWYSFTCFFEMLEDWDGWVLLLVAVAVSAVAGADNEYIWDGGFSGALRYIGKVLLAGVSGNMAGMALSAALIFIVMLVTGDIEGLLASLLPVALILSLVGGPAGGMIIIVFDK